ncbi:diguanylate cyclase [Alicyclobacillus tolerans]|uniref:GGDEF domain-containing protein n=1 Tax=Alicyclobacillus tolerans TaxID=90970 RepID=UPI003B7DB518
MAEGKKELVYALSLEAVQLQMKIMQGIVTGESPQKVLSLVLQGLHIRFPESMAAIWAEERRDHKRKLMLLATYRLSIDMSAWELHFSDEPSLSSPTDPMLMVFQEQCRDLGIDSVYGFPILNTKGHRVGWMGMAFHPSRTLTDAERPFIWPYVQIAGLVIEKEQLDRENDFLVHYDYLTEIPNRRFFHELLTKEMERSREEHTPLSLAILDLDNFKEINDTYGHLAGDFVLKTVAQRLQKKIGSEYGVARLGGDEFACLFPGFHKEEAFQTMLDLYKVLEEPVTWKEHTLSILASIGIASSPEDSIEEETLLRLADASLYQAKKSEHVRIQTYVSEKINVEI